MLRLLEDDLMETRLLHHEVQPMYIYKKSLE